LNDKTDHTGQQPADSPPGADREKTAGSNVQSQGGIGHDVATANGPCIPSSKDAVDVPGPSLDDGGGERPHDTRAHHGFSGDDGQHQATDSRGTATSAQPGSASDLGAQDDQRKHAIPDDPAERVSGADTPNQGGIAGSPGGPAREPRHVPGQDRDSDSTTSGSQSGNDPQRDSQI
jgi:hypothetical protein